MRGEKNRLIVLVLGFVAWSTSACVLSELAGPTATPFPTPTVSELIEGFSSLDPDERATAAAVAHWYWDHPDKGLLIPHLTKALSDSCPDVRMFAASSIGALGVYDQKAIDILISWLDEEERHTNDELIQGIGTLQVFANHASKAIPGLVRIMMNPSSDDPHLRLAAVHALRAIGDPVAVPYLLSILMSGDVEEWVRKDAAIALASYGLEARCTVPFLVSRLDSEEPDVRIGAALIISQATGNSFPGSERRNWDPDYLGAWHFERGAGGEYLIVVAAKEWWQDTGQHQGWLACERKLDDEIIP